MRGALLVLVLAQLAACQTVSGSRLIEHCVKLCATHEAAAEINRTEKKAGSDPRCKPDETETNGGE